MARRGWRDVSYMGLDIGTTGCKAVAFDDRGEELTAAYREYPLLTPRAGWAELDSAQVCESCQAVVRQVADACSADPVAGMGISTQGEAFTPVGADGEILGNAMVSSDARAAAIAETWSAQFGPEKLYRITGHTSHPMFTVFKLLWLGRNRPDVWSATRKFHCFEDLLHSRLGLEPAISWPLAGRTMMFNVMEHRWDDEIVSAAGLDRNQLARPLPSGTVVGTIPAGTAGDWGLGEGVAVVTAGHDQICSAFGAGVTSPGKAMYATGTVECICPAFSSPQFSDELFRANLCTYDYAIEGMYATIAYSLTGGNILKWFRDEFGQAEREQAGRTGVNPYEILLDKMDTDPSALMVLPYFTPSGTPYFDVSTPGAILGLRLTTGRGELLRALLEGVAFEMRLNIEIMERSGIGISQLIATGGGARSRVWNQLKADVIGKPFIVARTAETGCLGAATLAQAAVERIPPQRLAERNATGRQTIEPDPRRAEVYSERFAKYQGLYPELRRLDI